MTIKEIYNSEALSIRSSNVCHDNGLQDLATILKHYRENKTFDNLRNCGRKSNEELIALCLKYLDYDSNNITESLNPEKQHIIAITNLTRSQREIINSFIEINSNNLSNRSKNAFNLFLDGNLKIRNISERILNNDLFNICQIRNIGVKSATELSKFICSIEEFIEKISGVENENDLIVLKNDFYIKKTFSVSEIPNEILLPQSIFTLIDFLFNQNESNKSYIVDSESNLENPELSIVDFIPQWQQREKEKKYWYTKGENNIIFNKNVGLVFHKSFKIYNKQPLLTLDETAEDLNISRERARQLRKNCLEELFEKLQFIKNIDDDLFQKYGIDINQDFITINEDLSNHINQINNTNFSNEFISYLTYVYLSDKFELVGNIEDVMLNKILNSKNRHNWGRFYLVTHKLSNEFDFDKFTDDIYRRLNERIEENYNLNFNSYLINFIKNRKVSMLSIISPIAEMVINQEFDLIIDLNDNIVFKRNTLKQVSEFAIEALEKLSIPSKIEDIYKLIEKDYPGTTKSQDALRGSLQRTSEIIYFGRSSTYGLKKWEIENEGIRGGTIKEIIIDFIKDKKQPLHISLIMEHLRKYRGDRDERSIITNLKVDPDDRFIVFSQSFIGLKENIKFYSEKYNKLPVQLGKTIIGKHQKGGTRSEINNFLQTNFDLTFDESNLVINNLKYFNEN